MASTSIGNDKISYSNKILGFWLLEKFFVLKREWIVQLEEEKWQTGLVIDKLTFFLENTLSRNFLELIKVFSIWPSQLQKITLYVFQQLQILFNPFCPSVSFFLYSFFSKSYTMALEKDDHIYLRESKKYLKNLWVVDCLIEIIRSVHSIEIKDNSAEINNFFFEFSPEYKRKSFFDWQFFFKMLIAKKIFFLKEEKEKKKDILNAKFQPVFPFGTLSWTLKKNKEKTTFSQEEIKKKMLFYQKEKERCVSLLSNKNFLDKAPAFLVEKEKEKLNYFTKKEKELKKLYLSMQR